MHELVSPRANLCRHFPLPSQVSKALAPVLDFAFSLFQIIRTKTTYCIKRKIITARITRKYEYKEVLVMWCPNHLVRPDFVATVLAKYDIDVDIRNRWISLSSLSSQRVWGGAVAIFETEEQAMKAAKELETNSSHIKTIMFPNLLKSLIEAEIRHPRCGKESSRVVIYGKHSFGNESISEFEKTIYALGKVRHCKYYVGKKAYGIICTLEYAFTSQAFAAMTLLNDMFFKETGFLCVEMKESMKDKSILSTVRQHINQVS